MKQISLFIILLINSYFHFSQEIKAEETYQNCLYNSLPDNGVLLKKYNKEFENHLIKANVLKDSTSKAYLDLFKVLGTKEWRKFKYNYSYIDSILKIADYKTLNANTDCVDIMRKDENFNKSKYFKMKNIFLEEHKTIEGVLKIMALFLDERDFELDFYKQRTFFALEDLTTFPDLD